MGFFLMPQGSFSPKIRFLGQRVYSVARGWTDTKVKTEDTLLGFRNFLSTYHQGFGPITDISKHPNNLQIYKIQENGRKNNNMVHESVMSLVYEQFELLNQLHFIRLSKTIFISINT